MEPGYELDTLVAEKVMGDKIPKPGDFGGGWGESIVYGKNPNLYNAKPYSTDIAEAWKVVDKLAPLVGDFQEADGFFILKYADSADHSTGKECKPGEVEETEDGEDLYRWSCHFHPGHPGADTESARLFKDYRKSCVRGKTAAHAICLAALQVVREP